MFSFNFKHFYGQVCWLGKGVYLLGKEIFEKKTGTQIYILTRLRNFWISYFLYIRMCSVYVLVLYAIQSDFQNHHLI